MFLSRLTVPSKANNILSISLFFHIRLYASATQMNLHDEK